MNKYIPDRSIAEKFIEDRFSPYDPSKSYGASLYLFWYYPSLISRMKYAYIGSTANLSNRIKYHNKFVMGKHNISVCKLYGDEIRDREHLEYALINSLNTELNIIKSTSRVEAPYRNIRYEQNQASLE